MNGRLRQIPHPPLLLITDSAQAAAPLADICAAASGAGCRWFMIREKTRDSVGLAALTRHITAVVSPDAIVVVNGEIDAARAADAGGVHLQSIGEIGKARRVLPSEALVGYSAHSVRDARAAAEAGAGYVTLSPVFETESKPGYGPALEPSGIAEAVASVKVPVIGLAGISPRNAAEVIRAGAAGIAVMGGVMRSADPAAEISELIAAMGR